MFIAYRYIIEITKTPALSKTMRNIYFSGSVSFMSHFKAISLFRLLSSPPITSLVLS